MYDYLIVGSGLSGATFAYQATRIEPYALHFGHGSWKEKDYRQWLEEYKDLWQ